MKTQEAVPNSRRILTEALADPDWKATGRGSSRQVLEDSAVNCRSVGRRTVNCFRSRSRTRPFSAAAGVKAVLTPIQHYRGDAEQFEKRRLLILERAAGPGGATQCPCADPSDRAGLRHDEPGPATTPPHNGPRCCKRNHRTCGWPSCRRPASPHSLRPSPPWRRPLLGPIPSRARYQGLGFRPRSLPQPGQRRRP